MQLSKKSLPPFEGGRRVSHIVKQSARDLRRSIGQALDENNEQWEGILLLVICITPILYPFPFKIRVTFCVRFYLKDNIDYAYCLMRLRVFTLVPVIAYIFLSEIPFLSSDNSFWYCSLYCSGFLQAFLGLPRG